VGKIVVSVAELVRKSPAGIRVWVDISTGSPSDSFDVFRAEQAVGFDHQNDDQHVKRRDLIEIAPVQIFGIDKMGDVFQQADNDAAEHGATNAVEATKNHRREYLDAVGGQPCRYAVDDGNDHSGDGRDSRRDCP